MPRGQTCPICGNDFHDTTTCPYCSYEYDTMLKSGKLPPGIPFKQYFTFSDFNKLRKIAAQKTEHDSAKRRAELQGKYDAAAKEIADKQRRLVERDRREHAKQQGITDIFIF